jgi:hypothetical protein
MVASILINKLVSLVLLDDLSSVLWPTEVCSLLCEVLRWGWGIATPTRFFIHFRQTWSTCLLHPLPLSAHASVCSTTTVFSDAPAMTSGHLMQWYRQSSSKEVIRAVLAPELSWLFQVFPHCMKPNLATSMLYDRASSEIWQVSAARVTRPLQPKINQLFCPWNGRVVVFGGLCSRCDVCAGEAFLHTVIMSDPCWSSQADHLMLHNICSSSVVFPPLKNGFNPYTSDLRNSGQTQSRIILSGMLSKEDKNECRYSTLLLICSSSQLSDQNVIRYVALGKPLGIWQLHDWHFRHCFQAQYTTYSLLKLHAPGPHVLHCCFCATHCTPRFVADVLTLRSLQATMVDVSCM